MGNIKIYTVDQVAKILGIYKQNIYKDIDEGKIYPVKYVGRRIIIPELALKGYVYNLSKEEMDKLIREDINNIKLKKENE